MDVSLIRRASYDVPLIGVPFVDVGWLNACHGFHQRKVLDMIFDEPHRMRGTRLIRPIEPIQSFCSSASLLSREGEGAEP
jgi:hypothetical protein